MIENIFLALAISLGINLIFFIFAWFLKSDLFTDITYSMTFLITTIVMMIINKSYGVISIVMLALIGLWSIRLGSYLLIRIIKTKIDHRFDKMRNSFWKFGGFWLLQALTVWIVNMQVYIGLAINAEEFNYFSIIFIVLALGALCFETIADIQKWLFRNKNKGKFITKGLWKISRHPNYFGEISFWWMISGFAFVNIINPNIYIGIVAPIWITFTIYFLSGLPMLEKGSFKKHGNKLEYIEYTSKTPTLIPFIGKKGIKDSWKK